MTDNEIDFKKWRKFLDDRIKEVEDRNGKYDLSHESSFCDDDVVTMLDTIDRLQKQNERLMKAVEYYGAMSAVCRHDDSSWCDHCPDGGKRARKALKDCEEM